jgi:glycine/D-amino acid oxidase-like deaminating enzyme
MYDAIIVGGGFYGAVIAIYLKTQRGFSNVLLVERERDLLLRASYNNQARVHNGYHYPRSFTTAFRSRVNLPRFLLDYPQAVKRDFTMLYAIARRNSKVTAKQFERFCRDIGAKLEPAPDSMRRMFESRLVENVFLVEEYAFDVGNLTEWVRRELNHCGVQIRFNTCVNGIRKAKKSLSLSCEGFDTETLNSRYVFNCTYSGLNHIAGDVPGASTKLKHEIAEMVLIQAPPELASLGVTMMDGPFFSMMPFPARGLHTLSHVRYTPHCNWVDQPNVSPYQKLDSYGRETRVDRMVRDVARYMPAIQDAKYVESLFEVKTVLVKNEGDDGRPILFEKHLQLPGCYSILGGKIDNIYDVLEKLNSDQLDLVC